MVEIDVLRLPNLGGLAITAVERATLAERTGELLSATEFTGADTSGSIRMTLDRDRVPVTVHVDRHWRARMTASAFPDAVFAAYWEAAQKAWLVALYERRTTPASADWPSEVRSTHGYLTVHRSDGDIVGITGNERAIEVATTQLLIDDVRDVLSDAVRGNDW